MRILKKLFGTDPQNEQVKRMLKNGALVVDVRTPQEFQGGHVEGAKNYPLSSIAQKTTELQGINKEIVFCCASGNRSGQATRIMKAKGLACENGGSWKQVQTMLASE